MYNLAKQAGELQEMKSEGRGGGRGDDTSPRSASVLVILQKAAAAPDAVSHLLPNKLLNPKQVTPPKLD